MVNLWGELPKIEPNRGPKLILLEQAQILDDMTNHIVLATVETRSSSYAEDHLVHHMYLVAPLLNNYRVLILFVSHHLLYNYPCDVTDWSDREVEEHTTFQCDSEPDFVTVLGEVLGSEKIGTLIAAMMTQSKGGTLTDDQDST